MTEALDAMVKAMIAEFERQADEDGSTSVAEAQPSGVVAGFSRLDGYFDVEKVARAGLQAIKTPTGEMLEAGKAADWVGEAEGREGLSIIPSEAEDWDSDEDGATVQRPGIWSAMIDAILA